MEIKYKKFHGAGNDFILIDNRKNILKNISRMQINKLCDRHIGIGADGLIALSNTKKADFEMMYYNADGGAGSMCGNGARCITLFAYRLGIIERRADFIAYDGLHTAEITSINKEKSLAEIKVSMCDVNEIETGKDFHFLNTGSPHYVKFVDDVADLDVVSEGRKIRFNNRFKNAGTNVNFVAVKNERLFIRTYERGVENETLACGTGITASAIAAHYAGQINANTKYVAVTALGGSLRVYLKNSGSKYNYIFLQGPAEMVFDGTIEV